MRSPRSLLPQGKQCRRRPSLLVKKVDKGNKTMLHCALLEDVEQSALQAVFLIFYDEDCGGMKSHERRRLQEILVQ